MEHNFENSNKLMLMFVKKGLVLGPTASEIPECDSENELMVAGGWGEGGEGIVRKLGINMYTLLYLKWITNKDLL